MSEEHEFDIVCIGAGPAGEALCGELAGGDMSFAAIESNLVGGECPYWGCIPSKTLLRAAEVLAEANRAQVFAASEISYKVDYEKVYRRAMEMVRGLDDTKSTQGLEKTGAKLFRGAGRLTGPGQVEVDGTRLTARRAVVIATGTAPLVPPIEGLSGVEYWTNREAVLAAEQPARLVVLGAGAVGVELAQVYVRLGSEVHIIESTEFPLPLEEREAGKYLQESLVRDGVHVHCGAKAVKVSQAGKEISVTLDSGEVVTGDRLLVATGRKPNLDGIDLEACGLARSKRGFVQVDGATLEAGPGFYAIGDINGIGGFTHLSTYHGQVLGRALRGQKVTANHVAVPRVTFTDPEVASVGLSEAQAREKGIDVKTGGIPDTLNMTTRGYIHGEPGGMVKLVADRQRGVLVGATIVGPTAGEMIHEMTVAIRGGVPLATLADTIHAFPTFSRDNQAVFQDLAR
jgi:pyruvate/2-oxoglutarate dehydrogenase complex dihydrolipoamide dehydrogenase (E3) component